MSDEATFLNILRANPDDDATRLVYADWLEERGDARAEYLRLEAEAARIQDRLNALRAQFAPDWLAVVNNRQPRYNHVFHVHCELHLRSGRAIRLKSLHQGMTYAGLLEGTPNREFNDRSIEYVLENSDESDIGGTRPHLIPPPRRDYFRQPGDMQKVVAYSPHYIPEWLPTIRCIGSFDSHITGRNPDRHISTLTILWFQDEFALPIQELVLKQIQELDWDSLAVDIDIY